MSTVGRPVVGDWYERTDTKETFQVVSVDAATVQTQSFDGEVDSIDVEEWGEMPLVAAAEPEDWSGALGEVEEDDITEDDSPSERA